MGGVAIRTINGIAVPEGADGLIAERLRNQNYESHQLRLVGTYVEARHRVLEGGAALGMVTRALAERAQFVISFEVSSDLVICARYNAPKAVVLKRRLSVGSDAPPHTGDAFGVPQSDGSSVAVIDPIAAIDAYEINALVLDVEGEEAEILSGIDLEPLELVIAELHPPLYDARVMDEAKEKLNAAGFILEEEIKDGPLRHVAYAKG